ncbi:hypothetical protein ES704_00256 [subsurface metagenome]|jgi:hypothetical protein
MLKEWKTYEEIGTVLLNEMAKNFNLKKVEGKQKLVGKKSGLKWEIDAKGTTKDNKTFFVIEFRRYTTKRISQGDVASLRGRIEDLDAEGGILVSPLGFQKGAKKYAKSFGIIEVKMNENSTNLDYILEFLNKIIVGRSGKLNPKGSLRAKIFRSNGTIEDLGELKK